MRFYPRSRTSNTGFTLVEVLIAIVVCVIFAVAAYATNERLLLSLKAQRETTAASMMLQERIEAFRANGYSEIADKNYVKNNILTFNPNANPVPTPAFPPAHGTSQGSNATWSEGPLNNVVETVTVKGTLAATAPSPAPTTIPSQAYNKWIRDTSSGNGQPQEQNHDDHLATEYDLLQVDISITWTSANGRTRTRDLAATFGKGNVSQ
jgi:prepilin-type N-terminal cleavage/methylation domain-containing protein